MQSNTFYCSYARIVKKNRINSYTVPIDFLQEFYSSPFYKYNLQWVLQKSQLEKAHYTHEGFADFPQTGNHAQVIHPSILPGREYRRGMVLSHSTSVAYNTFVPA
jgi:hypothetical protein